METLWIDGQGVIVPARTEWEPLVRDGSHAGVRVYGAANEQQVKWLVSFVAAHEGHFQLGLVKPPGLASSWLTLPLLRHGAAWQRVQIERSTCRRCGWQGLAANPSEPSLYFGVPQELEATRRAASLPGLPCPRCRSPLNRLALWLEETSAEGGT